MRERNLPRRYTDYGSSWMSRHKRAIYILFGLALFLPSWIIGIWQTILIYGDSSFVPNLFALFVWVCMTGVVFPCAIGHGAFKRRYRPVTVAETTFDWNNRGTHGKAYTKQYQATEARDSVWLAIMVFGIFGLFFIPLFVGLPILSLFLPIGAVLLGMGSFNLMPKTTFSLRRFVNKRLPE
jgi:hypothetical protein